MANYEFLMNAHLIHDIAFVPNLVHIVEEIERPRAAFQSEYSGLESTVCITGSNLSNNISHFCVFGIQAFMYVRCEWWFFGENNDYACNY